MNVLLRSLAAASAGKEFRKKLSLNMGVGALKALCSKLFSVDTAAMKMMYRESREVIMPEELEDNLKDLGYYMVRDGSEIWVEDL